MKGYWLGGYVLMPNHWHLGVMVMYVSSQCAAVCIHTATGHSDSQRSNGSIEFAPRLRESELPS